MAIALSQNVGARSSGATIAMAFASPNASGSLLTLETGRASTTAGASTVTDSAGNLWLLAAAVGGGVPGTPSNQLWYAANAAGSTNTVSVTNSSGATEVSLSLQEWTGISTASPLIATSTRASTAAASTHSAGAGLSPSQSSVLFLAHFVFTSAFDITPDPSGYTATNSTFTGMQTFHKITSGSTSTEDAACGSSATEISAVILAAFSGVDGGAAAVRVRRSLLSLLGVS